MCESPHKVKWGNARPEAVWVRNAFVTGNTATVSGGGSPSDYFDMTHRKWRDRLTAHIGGSAFGDAGDIAFYNQCKSYLLELILPNPWNSTDGGYGWRTLNPAYEDFGTYDQSGRAGYSHLQWNPDNNGLGAIPLFLAGVALSGWSVSYGHLQMTRAQARYTGISPWIPYWSGRVRQCFDQYSDVSLPIRIDVTGGGWREVIDGVVLETVPFIGSSPFPLVPISNPLAPTFYQRAAITIDANFTVLGSDASTWSALWAMPFGVWVSGRTPISGPTPPPSATGPISTNTQDPSTDTTQI